MVYLSLANAYAKKYEEGDLDQFKEKNEDIYTYLLRSLWKGSKYDSKLRELSLIEFEEFNK